MSFRYFKVPSLINGRNLTSRVGAMFVSGRWIWVILGGVLLSWGLFRDGIHALVNQYHFYWSEALLFNVFWVGYPLGLLLISKIINWNVRPVFLTLAVSVVLCLHFIIFAAWVEVGSAIFLRVIFYFADNLKYALGEFFSVSVLIYGGATLGLTWNRRRKSSCEDADSELPPASYLMAQRRGRTVRLETEEIMYVRARTPYAELLTSKGGYLMKVSLDGLDARLDTDNFVRIHRSRILNLNYLEAYESRGNGDYNVWLTTGEELRLSRRYVNAFRKKLSTIHRLSDQ